MNRLEKAREFRNKINVNLQVTRKLIGVDELSEEELEDMIGLYDSYHASKTDTPNNNLLWISTNL